MCNLKCGYVRGVSDPRRAFRLAFRVTGISDHRYRSTIGVIFIWLGTPWSAGENWWYTWEHLGVLTTSLGARTTSLGAMVTSLGAPRITVEQSGRNIIFFGITTIASGNHSYSVLFNDFQQSCILFVFWSVYLCSYPFTHSKSVPAAGSGWEKFEVHLKMKIQWTERESLRLWFSKFADPLGGNDRANLEAIIEQVGI